VAKLRMGKVSPQFQNMDLGHISLLHSDTDKWACFYNAAL
jgi:hypothetical protein